MKAIACREAKQVMRLERLGSFHQSRLSFMRILTRRMARDHWGFERTAFEIDAQGIGHAVYTAHAPAHSYSLVAFAHELPPEQRSDRVIAEAWDATFTLFDGVPTAEDITRLSANVPRQEAGRVSDTELSLSRANRSVRLWEYVVSSLAAGRQPEAEQVAAVGYLMRTTAVYGSGKFGAADRETVADRPEFLAPFQVEMLSVYLTRWFVIDLVQHMADARADAQADGQAARLDPAIARSLGIGNSTGLGMAPFLLNHPLLIHNWISARERALQTVRSIGSASDEEILLFRQLLRRGARTIASWRSAHPLQRERIAALRTDLASIDDWLSRTDLTGDHPWDSLHRWAEAALSTEGQEWLASLMLEPYGALVDVEADTMADRSTDGIRIDGRMTVGELRGLLSEVYDWALAIDWRVPNTRARAWYVSEEKLEPRLGERFEEPIEAYEQPLAPGRDAATLFDALAAWPEDTDMATFLLRHPEHRHIVRRVQIVATAPYAEIRDNTISADLLPIDMLRCKLSFFGATQFDPRSDRWIRICMYAGAPLPQELTAENAEFWVYPAADADAGAGAGAGADMDTDADMDSDMDADMDAASSHSLNEIEVLCRRAARGTGLSWGLAEEAGKMARWLSGQGLPGPDLLVRLLDETDKMPVARMAPVSLDEPVWRSPSGRMNPIVAGAALSDAAAQVRERGGIEIDKLCLPLLLAPALAAAAAQAGSPLAASWQGVRLTSDGWRVACDGDDAALLTEMAERVLVTTDAAAPVSFPEVVSRATVPQDVLNTLARFAHRTYAPATEESRARGAGTGDSDND